MLFYWLDSIDSTHRFLVDMVKSSYVSEDSNLGSKTNNLSLDSLVLVIAQNQNSGIGSRGNVWEGVECGLYLSCALHKSMLSSDIALQSLSIYFGMIFLEIFREFNSDVWLKWPNDFYLPEFDKEDCKDSKIRDSKKIGGVITQVYKNHIIFGIGLNIFSKTKNALCKDPDSRIYSKKYYLLVQRILKFIGFENLGGFNFNKDKILKSDKKCEIFSQILWSDMFKTYKLEFHKSRNFEVHILGKKTSLKNSILQNDGSVRIKDKIFYSAR